MGFSALDDLLGTGTTTPSASNTSQASNATASGGDDLLDLLGGVSIGGVNEDNPPLNYVHVPFN